MRKLLSLCAFFVMLTSAAQADCVKWMGYTCTLTEYENLPKEHRDRLDQAWSNVNSNGGSLSVDEISTWQYWTHEVPAYYLMNVELMAAGQDPVPIPSLSSFRRANRPELQRTIMRACGLEGERRFRQVEDAVPCSATFMDMFHSRGARQFY